MTRTGLALVAWAALGVASASAGESLIYAPPPPWVRPVPIPPPPAGPGRPALDMLLSVSQARYSRDAVERYVEAAYRITSSEGLAGAGDYNQTWDPQTEDVTIHKLEILRGGATIDALARGRKLTVIRREKNLEAAILDGRLTATTQLDGLRVGDIVHFAVSIRRSEPVLRGDPGDTAVLFHKGVIAHQYDREIWPADMKLRWRASDDLPKPSVTTQGGWTELEYDLHDSTFKDPPTGAPARFLDVASLQVSPNADWAEVSALMAPLYAKASTIPRDSPLRAEIARIRKEAATPEARTLAALRLVQDQVRYLFIGLNSGDFTPADAAVTWTRRFGDCKGKTALLLGLLRELGIEAQPVLLNSAVGDALPTRLPSAHAFDHVLVRARIGGRTVWLDGTRIGDRRLDALQPPAAHYVLPVQPQDAKLESVLPAPPSKPLQERRLALDATSGADGAVKAHAEQVYREDAAVVMAAAYKATTAADAESGQRRFWADAYSWIDVDRVSFSFDEASRVATMTMDGVAHPPWSKGRLRDLDLADTSLGWDAAYKREPGPHADAPWTADYPAFSAAHVEVRLPKESAAFSILNAEPIDRTIAGVRYRRDAKLEHGVLIADSSSFTTAPEFPADEAAAARTALYEMSSHDVSLRWNAGPIAVVEEEKESAAPASATEFAGRGVRRLSAGDLAGAQDDLAQAVRLAPDNAKYRYNLGVAQAQASADAAAAKSFGEALRLAPHDYAAHFARAQLRLEHDDLTGADADARAAAADSEARGDLEYRIARAYERHGLYAQAHVWLKRSLVDSKDEEARTRLLSAECEAGAWDGRDLKAALEACSQALTRSPQDGVAVGGRGLIRLRQQHWAEADADLSLAITLARPSPASRLVYARGLARKGTGKAAEAASDIAEAKRVDPQVADYFVRAGLAP